ncbi:MAG: hypothetical protein ACRESI_05835 [Gammaproteobacteria bacterium]
MPPTLQHYLTRVANIAISGSTVRNQGARGVVNACREFLQNEENIQNIFNNNDFQNQLNITTTNLVMNLPNGAQNFGTARKAINVFLEECYYHREISNYFGVANLANLLEVPLDQDVANFLNANNNNAQLPHWHGIIHLTPDVSNCYQEFAMGFAMGLGDGWCRIHIDLLAWRHRG